MNPCSGWLFDLYAHPEKGVVFWLLGDDEKPHCFFDRGFEVPFYASGAVPRLRELWRFLRKRKVKLQYTQREDLFSGLQDVVEVRVPTPRPTRGCSRRSAGISPTWSSMTRTSRCHCGSPPPGTCS